MSVCVCVISVRCVHGVFEGLWDPPVPGSVPPPAQRSVWWNNTDKLSNRTNKGEPPIPPPPHPLRWQPGNSLPQTHHIRWLQRGARLSTPDRPVPTLTHGPNMVRPGPALGPGPHGHGVRCHISSAGAGVRLVFGTEVQEKCQDCGTDSGHGKSAVKLTCQHTHARALPLSYTHTRPSLLGYFVYKYRSLCLCVCWAGLNVFCLGTFRLC